EDGIRDFHVTGVQTCALPILYEVDGHLFFDLGAENIVHEVLRVQSALSGHPLLDEDRVAVLEDGILSRHIESEVGALDLDEKVEIGRASCRERVWRAAGGGER